MLPCRLLLVVVLFLLLLLPAHHATHGGGGGGASSSTWRSIPSLLRSLLSRVANHRLARGDVAGAKTARMMAEAIGSGFQFWKGTGTMAWDYLIHYSWRHWKPSDVMYLVSLINELHAAVGEVTQLRSSSERVLWVSANFDRLQQIAKSVFEKLLEFFNRSGALRHYVLVAQKELINGELIRDAFELGSADLQGLIQVAKDILQRYVGSYSSSASSDL